MQAGIAADKERKFDVAIAEYKKVTELDPTLPDGFVSLGQAYMENGDYGSAIPPLKQALEMKSGSRSRLISCWATRCWLKVTRRRPFRICNALRTRPH